MEKENKKKMLTHEKNVSAKLWFAQYLASLFHFIFLKTLIPNEIAENEANRDEYDFSTESRIMCIVHLQTYFRCDRIDYLSFSDTADSF